ncbi:hypothetical protein [Nocardioides plantarum]|uniref:Uncharacterized protein n=1 Tax=Nocardioides plantarum TaxID=29299 RepID=A0ABV5K8H5_9ACTN|nr:hypothetical protein [Nocardioides plantarum]
MTGLLVQYTAVGQVARDWDEQHHRLLAAAEQVAAAPLAGLTAPVVGMAMMFRYRWTEHVRDLAARAEGRADGLRDTLRDFVHSDESSALTSARLRGLLTELR